MHFASETSKYAKLVYFEPVSSIANRISLCIQDVYHPHDAQRS